jgi:transposase
VSKRIFSNDFFGSKSKRSPPQAAGIFYFDTTSCNVWGDEAFPETQDMPFRLTDGDSKDKRPALKQFGLSMRCVDRALPIWGKPEDGQASDKTLNTTLLSEIAPLLARYGVAPGAYISIADAAWGTETNRQALGNTCCITRFPATSSLDISSTVAPHILQCIACRGKGYERGFCAGRAILGALDREQEASTAAYRRTSPSQGCGDHHG